MPFSGKNFNFLRTKKNSGKRLSILQTREYGFPPRVILDNPSPPPPPRRREVQESANRGISKKADLSKTVFSFPLLKMNQMLLNCGMIALMTVIQKTVDQFFDIFLQSEDFGHGISRNLSSCKVLVNFLTLHHQPP